LASTGPLLPYVTNHPRNTHSNLSQPRHHLQPRQTSVPPTRDQPRNYCASNLLPEPRLATRSLTPPPTLHGRYLLTTTLSSNNISSTQNLRSTPYKNGACFIPWKGKILEPSYNQIRKFGGNLDLIMKHVGFRDPTPRELGYRQIRIYFSNQILVPTPRELLQAKGDLHLLKQMFPNRVLDSKRDSNRRQASKF